MARNTARNTVKREDGISKCGNFYRYDGGAYPKWIYRWVKEIFILAAVHDCMKLANGLAKILKGYESWAVTKDIKEDLHEKGMAVKGGNAHREFMATRERYDILYEIYSAGEQICLSRLENLGKPAGQIVDSYQIVRVLHMLMCEIEALYAQSGLRLTLGVLEERAADKHYSYFQRWAAGHVANGGMDALRAAFASVMSDIYTFARCGTLTTVSK